MNSVTAMFVMPSGERIIEQVRTGGRSRAPDQIHRVTLPKDGVSVVQHFQLVHQWESRGEVSFVEYELISSRIERHEPL